MTAIIPSRIEWAGPSGWKVWADEDGVHLRAPHGDTLESGEVTSLKDLINSARTQVANGVIPAPKPPTREEMRELGWQQREADYANRAARAVLEALAPTATDIF